MDEVFCIGRVKASIVVENQENKGLRSLDIGYWTGRNGIDSLEPVAGLSIVDDASWKASGYSTNFYQIYKIILFSFTILKRFKKPGF